MLGDAQVSDIMRPAVLAPGWLTVSAFWNEWVNRYPDSAFLLESWGGDAWKGVVTAQQLAGVPPSMQGSVRAQDVALPLAPPAPGRPSPPEPGPARLGFGRPDGRRFAGRRPWRHSRCHPGRRYRRHGVPGHSRPEADLGHPAPAHSRALGVRLSGACCTLTNSAH